MTDKKSDKDVIKNSGNIGHFPDSPISHEDEHRLESFGGHEMTHGRATLYHWDKDASGNPVFEIYRGAKNDELVTRIGRHRSEHEFFAEDSQGNEIVVGTLDHVMGVLDKKFAEEHGETY